MSSTSNKTIQNKTEQLTKLVAWFDSEDFDIEQALGKFKEAETLAAEIESDLIKLKNNVQVLKNKFSDDK